MGGKKRVAALKTAAGENISDRKNAERALMNWGDQHEQKKRLVENAVRCEGECEFTHIGAWSKSQLLESIDKISERFGGIQ